MSASLVQHKHAENVGAASLSVTLDTAPSPGHLLVAFVSATANVTSPVHPWGNTPDVSVSATSFCWITSKIAVVGESSTITFSNGLTRGLTIDVYEFAPTPGRTWVGVDKTASNSSGSAITLTVGPTAAQTEIDDAAVAGISLVSSAGSLGTLSDGYTVATGTTSAARGWSGYKTLSGTGTTQSTGNWTTLRAPSAALATYKQTGTATVPAHAAFLSLLKHG